MAHLSRGFVQMRRGLLEHIRAGRLTGNEGSLFMWLVLEADPCTGIVYGSAGLFATVYGWSARNVREWLEGLERKGYIRRFSKPGSHACYPILINKYLCSHGAMRGKVLNAVASVSCINPAYDSCEEDGEDIAGDLSSSLPEEERKRKRIRKTPVADATGTRSQSATIPADERHAPCREAVAAYWRHHNPDHQLPWDGSEGKTLASLLRAMPALNLDQFRDMLRARSRSERVNHADRPRLWLQNITRYSQGPLDGYGKPLLTRSESAPQRMAYADPGALYSGPEYQQPTKIARLA